MLYTLVLGALICPGQLEGDDALIPVANSQGPSAGYLIFLNRAAAPQLEPIPAAEADPSPAGTGETHPADRFGSFYWRPQFSAELPSPINADSAPGGEILDPSVTPAVASGTIYFNPAGEPPPPPAAGQESKRRALPAPFFSPPFPSSEYFGSPPLIGVPATTPPYALTHAMQGTWLGNFFNDNRIQVYGWVDVGGNLSTSKNSNVPVSYDIVPNSIQLDQAILRFERIPDSVQTSSMDWGFRFTNLYGIDYRYTTAKGWFSNQLLQHNDLYGYDPLECYGLLYVPWVAQGMILKLGRYVSPPDIEAQLAPDNYLYSHSIMYTYDPYTFTGLQAEIKMNDQWTGWVAAHAGNDMAPWTNSAQLNGEFLARWVSKDNKDSILGGLDSIGGGQFSNQHDNLQVAIATWTHKFTERFHTESEAYFIWQHGALMGGTVTNGNPYPYFESVGPGTFLPGISYDVGAVNYTNYMISPRDYVTLRNDMLWDPRGERTGIQNTYSEVTLGWCHFFNHSLFVRPEIRFDRAWENPAYDNGLRKNQGMIAADIVYRF